MNYICWKYKNIFNKSIPITMLCAFEPKFPQAYPGCLPLFRCPLYCSPKKLTGEVFTQKCHWERAREKEKQREVDLLSERLHRGMLKPQRPVVFLSAIVGAFEVEAFPLCETCHLERGREMVLCLKSRDDKVMVSTWERIGPVLHVCYGHKDKHLLGSLV